MVGSLSSKQFNGFWAAGALTMIALWYILGDIVWSPNSYMYAFGGDPLVLYYNTLYHSMHGSDIAWFDAMLYPHRELIYLTDAQGALAGVLQWISSYVPAVSDYTLGIIHTANNLAMVLAGSCCYLVLRRLQISNLLAIGIAPAIALLSPQMLRHTVHFGLAYAFIIPLSILWMLRSRIRPDWRDLGMILLMLFFTFNNPYTGFSAGLTLLLYAGIAGGLAFRTPDALARRQQLLPAVIVGLGTAIYLGIPFLIFKVFDPFTSRIGTQWGPLIYRTSWRGTFAPQGSFIGDLLETSVQFEALQYVGLLTMIGLGLGIFCWAIGKIRVQHIHQAWWHYCLAAFIIYILCFDFNLSEATGRAIEDKAGWVLLFKAFARIAWPFYFAMSITAVVFWSELLRYIPANLKYMGLSLACLLSLGYYVDVGYYHAARVTTLYPNRLSRDAQQEVSARISDLGIDASDYVGVLTVPRILFWNSNVLTEMVWDAHYHATRISITTGLPFIQGLLGRSPVNELMDITELMSRSAIDRKRVINQYGKEDKILLVRSASTPFETLAAGEKYLLQRADSIGVLEQSILYSLPLKRLLPNAMPPCNSRDSFALPSQYIHLDYDNNEPSPAIIYAGASALQLPRGAAIVLDTTWQGTTGAGVITLFIEAPHRRYGMGTLYTASSNAKGQRIHSQTHMVREIRDADERFYAVFVDVPLERGGRVEVSYITEQPIVIDELQVRLHTQNTVIDKGDSGCLYNGSLISY